MGSNGACSLTAPPRSADLGGGVVWDLCLGNCVEVMAAMTRDSVDLVITSPPYDNLRDYGGTQYTGDKTKRVTFHNKKTVARFGLRHNVWEISNPGKRNTKHPATFPDALVRDHLISWSNPGDLVLDPEPLALFVNGWSETFLALRLTMNISTWQGAVLMSRKPNALV